MCLHWTLSKRYFVPPHCNVYQTVKAWDLFFSFWLICVELRRWFRLLEQGPSCQGKDMSEALLGADLVFPIPAWQRPLEWAGQRVLLALISHYPNLLCTFCVRNVSFSVFFWGRLCQHLQMRILSILWFSLTVSLHISDRQSILSSIYDKTGKLLNIPLFWVKQVDQDLTSPRP